MLRAFARLVERNPIEGAQAFEGRLESIQTLFDAGVRMVGLTHFVDNEVGGSVS